MRRFSSLALMLSLLACHHDKPTPVEPPEPTVASITVTPSVATLNLGATATLSATARDASGDVLVRSFTWSSSATSVASVAGGVVTAVGPGTATINAVADGVTGTATITVVVPASNEAFDSLTYSTPTSLTYTTKDGSSVTGTVFPGQVIVTVDPQPRQP